jgi:hypothetical protein
MLDPANPLQFVDRRALKNCQKGNAGECTVRVTDCNK